MAAWFGDNRARIGGSNQHGMNHGAAHRVSLTARQAGEPQPASTDGFVDGLYAGRKAGLRPIHDELIRTVTGFGADGAWLLGL